MNNHTSVLRDRHESYDGPGAEFAGIFVAVCHEHEAKESRWVRRLKEQGVMAAHPDDGWVNRETNEVHLCYPYFDNGPSVGSIIVLGDYSKSRRCVVTGIRDSIFGMRYYSFEECCAKYKG